jgi:hypothetical protein
VAGETAVRVLSHQQFDYITTKILNGFAVSRNLSIRHWRSRAGSDCHLSTVRFNLNHARPTRALWLHLRVVAEVRDVNILIQCRLQDRLALFCDYVATINLEGSSIGHAEISERLGF